MLSPGPEHDFLGSEMLGEVSGDLPEELLGALGALLGPEWGPRAAKGVFWGAKVTPKWSK